MTYNEKVEFDGIISVTDMCNQLQIKYEDESISKLLCAILLQAVKDYVSAKRRVLKGECKPALEMIEDVEDFFMSKWFKQLYHKSGQDYVEDLRNGTFTRFSGNIIGISPEICTLS